MGAEMCRRKPTHESESSQKTSLNQVFSRYINQMFPSEKISTKHTLTAVNSLSKEDIGGPLNVYTTNTTGWSTAVLTVGEPDDQRPIPPPRRRRKPRPGQAIQVTNQNQETQIKQFETISINSLRDNLTNNNVQSELNEKQNNDEIKDKYVDIKDDMNIKLNNNNNNNNNNNYNEEELWPNHEHSLVTLPRNMSKEDLEETAQRIKTYMKRCRSFGSFDASQFVTDLCSGRIEVTVGAEDLSDDECEYLPVKGLAPFQPTSRLAERKISNSDFPNMSAQCEELDKKKDNVQNTLNEVLITKDNEKEQDLESDEDDELETLERFQQYRSLAHRRPSAPRDFPDIVEVHPVVRRESLPVINDTDEILEVVDYGFRGSFSGVSHCTPPSTPVRVGSLDHSNLLNLLKENKEKNPENPSPDSLTPSLNELEIAITELLENRKGNENEIPSTANSSSKIDKKIHDIIKI